MPRSPRKAALLRRSAVGGFVLLAVCALARAATPVDSSGGPVWYEEGGQHYLVGIHTGNREVFEGGELVDAYNTAVHINEEIYNKLRDTMLANDTVVYPELGADVDSTVGTTTACPAATVALVSLWSLMLVAARRRWPRPTRPVSDRSGPPA